MVSGFDEKHRAELYEVLWQHAIVGICIVAEDGTFLRANPAFCDMVEYTEKELQQKTFQEITTIEDLPVDEELANEVATGKRDSYNMIKSYQTKTRRIVWADLKVVPFKVGDKFGYFVSQAVEIPDSVVTHANEVAKKQSEKPQPLLSTGISKGIQFVTSQLTWIVPTLFGIGFIIQQFL